VLGSDVLGVYFVILTVVTWLLLGGRAGILDATSKRISEGNKPGEYFTAGFVLLVGFVLVVGVVSLAFRSYIESYVGFSEYSTVPVVLFIILMLAARLLFLFSVKVLKGERRVHLSGTLRAVIIAFRGLTQVVFVLFGFAIVGLLSGYVISMTVIALLGLALVNLRPQFPDSEQIRSILDYARYSWLGGLQSRALNDADILVLNAFVAKGLVGVYGVAWTFATFLNLFGNAVSTTIFPEISNLNEQEGIEEAKPLIEDAIAYAGLFAIPGLVGGFILSERLLLVYGPDFVRGTEVFKLLLLSITLYGYFYQFLNALNGIDAPDAAFRANMVFVVSNILLNILLVWQIGFIGAAVASVISVCFGMAAAYGILSRIIDIALPLREISRQIAAALVMGGIVVLCERGLETTGLLQQNILIVGILVLFGACVYGGTLFVISSRFRATVRRNLPFEMPM
jgi:O-antigen/teichoic acid export membrane protein